MVPLAGGALLMPTVVRAHSDGTVTVGDPDASHDDPFRTGRDFKRLLGNSVFLGGRPYSASFLLTAMLNSVIKTVTAAESGPPSRVVLTHPLGWDLARRELLAGLAKDIGLDPATVLTLSEPEAAAAHYAGRGQPASGAVVVIQDFGAGSIDTVVARTTSSGLQILGEPASVELSGGVGFDDAVLSFVDHAVDGALSALDPRELAAAATLQRVRAECVRAKERLSREDATTIPVLLPDRHTSVRLTRSDFEGLINGILQSSLAALHGALRSASVEPGDLTSVLLVGGNARIPAVARRIGADLGRPVLLDPHPEHCVALGAVTPAGRSAVARRPVRRRMAFAAAATAVLAGGAAYTVGALPFPAPLRQSEAKEAVAETSVPVVTASPVVAPTSATPTVTATARPATKATHKKKKKPRKPPKPVSPALPLSGTVLGLQAQCLDVSNASTDNGTTIQTTNCNGTAAQIWNLRTDHTFRALTKCMEIAPIVGSRHRVQLHTCNGSAGQKWRLVNGAIVNTSSKLCLDIVGNSPADRTPTELSSCGGSDAGQKWKLSASTVVDTSG
jgi:actin-like ATPase involved in cell morphogenesis